MARLVFLGTPGMAVDPLRALVAAGHDVALCVTRPDRRRGRGKEETPSPVKEAALELGIPVSHAMDDALSVGAELGVVVAYGRIIPAGLLAQLPMVNVHFSLLPRWRGAAPLERAILAGDGETGVCLMKVEEGLDTGPVYARRTVPLDDDTDLESLRLTLVAVGCDLLVELLAGGAAGLPVPVPQEGEPTTADKISTSDLHLRWDKPAVQLHRVIRLGRAWTTFRGRRLGVLGAEVLNDEGVDLPPGRLEGTIVGTGQGQLRLRMVQPESRTPMAAEDWVRGVRPTVGERLDSD
ncbi:MAG TPA: methionyl-tRNA formyltransferase [Acidimicrobiales bacterium]|jgi:methionyl-tRNA formyltransferase|nr:methionyl-tRNA formyltransferase [Acidimicrobiales bacterium]